jgi:manganese efflux pump family protein
VLAVLAFVLPLGLDAFAVSAALGARRPNRAQRWRLSVFFVLCEAGAPLVGLAVGAPVARLVGSAADYVAAAALVGTGLWLLFDSDDDERLADRVLSASGWAVFTLGLAISLDELAIGFSLGLVGLPIAAVIIAIAVQTLIASQLGLALGARIGEVWRERAQQLAGLVLITLGGFQAITHLVG